MSRARDLADRVLHNRTHEDTDGGRESIVTFKGEQSGGEISTLAQIQASHDGTADDQKADLIFKTNDGNDGTSPTEALRIDSEGQVGLGISSPAQPLHVFKVGSSGGGLAPLIKVQNDTNNLTGDGAGIEFHGKYQGGEWGFGKIGGTNSGANFGGALEFHTNAGTGSVSTGFTKKIRIDTDGLKFNGDTAAANALDDYEHGSGNASITGSGGGTITTSGDKTYYYTKIGNLVHFQVEFSVTGIGGCSGATQIALPFQSIDYVAGSVRAYAATYTGNSLFCEAHPSGTQVLIKSQSSGNASHDVLSSTTSYYFVTLTYIAT